MLNKLKDKILETQLQFSCCELRGLGWEAKSLFYGPGLLHHQLSLETEGRDINHYSKNISISLTSSI